MWLIEDSDQCPLCKKSVLEDEDEEASASTSASPAAAVAGVHGAAVEPSTSQSAAAADSITMDDAEDAPLLRPAGRHRPRRYGSRLRGTLITRRWSCVIKNGFGGIRGGNSYSGRHVLLASKSDNAQK